MLPNTSGAGQGGAGTRGWTRALAEPRIARLDFLMSKVGTEGLLGGLSVISVWQQWQGAFFTAFPLLIASSCQKSEAGQGGGGRRDFPYDNSVSIC